MGSGGISGVICGAGPRTVRESNAKRADKHIVLARTLSDLLCA